MAGKAINMWGVLAAIVRSFEGNRRRRSVRAGGHSAQPAFGSQAATYGISSSMPPMR